MVKCYITPRFFNQVVSSVFLLQTDTTVGFLSQNEKKLHKIKSRAPNKPFITVYKNFNSFKNDNKRVPNRQKQRVRRAKKATFIINNFAFRIVTKKVASTFLDVPWYFSTSANEASKSFDRGFCESKTDIIIETKEGLHEKQASSLFKINANKIRRLR